VILCAVVIGNKELIAGRAPVAPALLVGTFGPQDEQALRDVTSAAALIGGVYGQDPANVPPELQEACRLENDDTFHPDRRRLVPAHLFPNRQLWLFDTILLGSHFDSGAFDSGWIPCLAQPGTHGTIAQLPSGLAVFKEAARPPKIIRHQERKEPPPLVAPHSDNLPAVEAHIARHIGEPVSVFHEVVSTTVHIDVHIVPASEEKPWITLVTSGMSDIPMNAPDGAEEFRLAELMIRLPAEWKLDEESIKQ
jgi:hypothetical protein